MKIIRCFSQATAMFVFLTLTMILGLNANLKVEAHSVCGLKKETAAFKTKSYLVTICPGEASFQLILTYHDGTGYKRIPVQQEGRRFRGSDGKNNYIIDRQVFVIGTDGKQPIREVVLESR
ncbi:hypothetical protein [Gloeothece verrucosa]|uniref:C-type lysozyme inhibitor domain-containing protein n=1 Tax=Gloeothece verrucosa (strain PCC 7822) TaxID=497965 RepID=E0UKZ7_GLOV7|nr:hypothetical protein [Gloeothece verrucosa]ADN17627.1 hypothetical protein Cyan7822_5766 [Gloeothece verrucosa PCC 7822]